jgi:hypothetical protein
LDADADGFNNLMEYAFKRDPAVSDKNPISGADTDTSLSIIYPRNTAATDLKFTVEESSDLGVADPWQTWEAGTFSEEILSTANGVQQVKATRTLLPAETRRFLKVRAAIIP